MFRVKDPEKSLHFYRDCLGMTLLAESHHGDFSLYFLAQVSHYPIVTYHIISYPVYLIFLHPIVSCHVMSCPCLAPSHPLLHTPHFTLTPLSHPTLHPLSLLPLPLPQASQNPLIAEGIEKGTLPDPSTVEAKEFMKTMFGPVIELTHNHGTEKDADFK
jgi:catechol 2,3-dioxygenase-like lactoylglutathione lyase family enzyme